MYLVFGGDIRPPLSYSAAIRRQIFENTTFVAGKTILHP